MRKFIYLVIGIIGLVILSGCNFSLASDITPPPNYTPEAMVAPTNSPVVFPLVAPDPKQGAQLFTEHCVPCHGAAGLGDGPQASKLPNPVAAIGTADVAHQASPSTWFQVITNGNLARFMPPFASSLSDAQRWDVLAYVYSLSMPDKSLVDGKALFQQQCAACHGESGKGDGTKAASLSKPPKNLTDQSLSASLSANDLFGAITNGSAPDMPAFASQLNEDQRWSLAAYVRSLTFSSGSASGQASAATPAGPASTLTPVPAGADTPTPGGPTQTPSTLASTPASGTPTVAATTAAGTTPTVAVGTTVAAGTAGAGTINGKITFDPGVTGSLPTGLTVNLVGYDAMTPAFTKTAPVQPDGSYTIENVDMKSGRFFMASVILDQVTFNSDVVQPQAGAKALNLPIAVHATSSDASTLSVDRMHIFLDFSTPGSIQVVELFIITNPTNKVIIPAASGQAVITFKMPAGATGLQFQDGQIGQRYLATADGFGDTASVAPGTAQHQVLFAYNMVYQDKLDLSLPVPLPVKAAVVLLPQNGVSVQGGQLVDGGVQNVQGSTFRVYNGSDITKGGKLSFSLSGSPKQSAPTTSAAGSSTPNLIIGGGVFLLALLLTGGWLVRSGVLKLRPVKASQPAPRAEEDPEPLIEAILTLDDLHKEGRLAESAYQSRRAELKDRLRGAFQAPKPTDRG
jgi:mono/diheme cytochrome c family protein